MTSCFVYKVMGLTFHDRINTQLIYRSELAQVVARKITKPQFFLLGSNLTGSSFFIQFFSLGGGGGGSDFIILFVSFFSFLSISFNLFIPCEMAKSLCCLLIYRLTMPSLVMNFDAIRVYFRIYSSLCCYRCFIYVPYTC